MKKTYVSYVIGALLIFCGCSSGPERLQFKESTIRGTPGFVRVGQTDMGQWWFIDPNGKPFFYKGVCAVNRAGTQGGRRAHPGQYAFTIDRKYNYQDSPDQFVDASVNTLKDLNFNATGAWTTEEFFNTPFYFTEILEFFKEGPFFEETKLPDIFSEEWHYNIDKKARAICSPLRNSSWLVGYFTDNEIGFGNVNDFGFDLGFEANAFKPALLRQLLSLPSERKAFQVAASFILERYQRSFTQLSQAWGISVTDWEDFREWNKQNYPIPGQTYAIDAEAFVSYFASCYFESAAKVIHRYDPNHLILGCRFGGPPSKEILSAIVPWTDVISANNYQPILYERYDSIYKQSGLPILIGEFSWNTSLYKEIPFPDEIREEMPMKERMFRRGEQTLRRLPLQDGFVGYTWYRWVQGKAVEPHFSDGIVDYEDLPSIHNECLRNINRDMEAIRLKYADGKWKEDPVYNGEMTFFFYHLRKDWTQYIRVEFHEGKPVFDAFGWLTHLKVLTYEMNEDNLRMKFRIDFDEYSPNPEQYPAGIGTYEIEMTRDKEIFTGTLIGQYESQPVFGSVKAYYFPE